MKVSIILTHHLSQNNNYLLAALDGIASQNTSFDFETILLSDAEYLPPLPLSEIKNLRIVHDRNIGNASQKFRYAIETMKISGEYILCHSDDVVLSAGSLNALVLAQDSIDVPMIQNPMCNGDTPSKYITPIAILSETGAQELIPQNCDLEWYKTRINFVKYIHRREMCLVPFPFVSFYCTLIPLKLIQDIGMLDERLDYKNNDVDYCLRAAQKGYPAMVNFGAFALHFGSKTLNIVKKPDDDEKADKVFREKHFGEIK